MSLVIQSPLVTTAADSLFFVYILISIAGFGIHIPLIAYFARKHDSLIVTVYRNLSFIPLIMPLLFFVPFSEIAAIKDHVPVLVVASAIGLASFLWSLQGMQRLPVGVSNAIARAFNVVFSIILGALFFGEYLSSLQLVLLAALLGCAVALSLLRSQHEHLDASKKWEGSLYSVLAGTGVSLSFFLFGVLSREIHPLVAGYFWESSIGICALGYLLFQLIRGRHEGPIFLPLRQAAGIAGASLFVIAGTGGLALALNHGPYPLALGLGSSIIMVTTLISWFLFKERLRKLQIAFIVGTIMLMFLMRMYS